MEFIECTNLREYYNTKRCTPQYQLSTIILKNRLNLGYELEDMANLLLCDKDTYLELEFGEVTLPINLYNKVIEMQEDIIESIILN